MTVTETAASESRSLENALTIANAVRLIRRWWWLLVIAAVIPAGFTYRAAKQTAPYYQSSTTIMVGRIIQQVYPNTDSIGILDRLTAIYASLATREPVLKAAAQDVSPPTTAADIASRVHVRAVGGTQYIEIAYLDTDPKRAAEIVSAVANELIKQSPKPAATQNAQQIQFTQDQLQDLQTRIGDAQTQLGQLGVSISNSASAAEIGDLQERVKALNTQIDTWRTTYTNLLAQTQPSETNYLAIAEPAGIPKTPITSSGKLTSIVSGAFGFAIAFVVILLIEYIDDALRGPEGVTEQARLRLLATIPRRRKSHGTPDTTPFRAVRNQLLRNHPDTLRLVIVSPTAGAGTTTAAQGLAEAMAKSGRRVILVDANLAAPSLHTRYGIPIGPGLTDLLIRRAGIEIVLQRTETVNLLVVPAGDAAGNEDLLGAQILPLALTALLERAQADVLIVDGGVLQDAASTACTLIHHIPETIVIAAPRTRVRALKATFDTIADNGATAIGVIFNTPGKGTKEEHRRTDSGAFATIPAGHEYAGGSSLPASPVTPPGNTMVTVSHEHGMQQNHR